MKSLFLRLLVSMWVTLTLLVGVFALIHAWAFPMDQSAPRRRQSRGIELRAESALRCARDRLPDCGKRLAPMDERDSRLAIYRDGVLLMGEPVAGATAIVDEARRSPDGSALRVGEEEVAAVVLDLDPTYVAVSSGPARSPWMFFIVPETLPHRLLAIVVVSGLVSVLLARWLSRPVRVLRAATQQLAAGDLSVRVSPSLRGADGETQALGREMDRMAERIQELLEAQRRLLRDVSHELRSPLARLGIALELVRRRSPADVEPAFDRIERETERLNAMIGELLTLSRLESGQGLGERRKLDLEVLLGQVVEDVAFEAEQHGCRVEAGERASCWVDASEELLRRAIENVLRNAVRFTESGSTVQVDLRREGDAAVLVVRDQGPGVPDAQLADIFKPFYRVGDDRARHSGGTGIGLAITERAVLLHGGSVRARNAAGGGLEVRITLPESTADSGDAAARSSSSALA